MGREGEGGRLHRGPLRVHGDEVEPRVAADVEKVTIARQHRHEVGLRHGAKPAGGPGGGVSEEEAAKQLGAWAGRGGHEERVVAAVAGRALGAGSAPP